MNKASEHDGLLMGTLTMIHLTETRARPCVIGCLVCLTVALITGCRTAPQAAPSGSSIDRLMERYPEMRAGRFSVIADFEDDKQLELFHVQNVSGSARIEVGQGSQQRRLVQAGASGNGLWYQSASSDDILIVNNDHATNWYLKRDWRDYDLLRLAVDAPQDDLMLTLMIRGGARRVLQSVVTSTPLRRGRNELRFDLAELGEHLPLDEVRELRLSLNNVGHATGIRLDDILLTRDRETMVGDPRAMDESLFVERIGRRYHIGAGKRFELIFGNGQIVGWYDLAEDPHRLHNLVAGTSLGPMIETDAPAIKGTTKSHFVAPTDSLAEVKAFHADAATEVHTVLLEASAVRAVLSTEWYFRSAENKGRASTVPDRRWVYTIYPTGDVYVRLQAVPARVDERAGEDISYVLRVATACPGDASDSHTDGCKDAMIHGSGFVLIRPSDRSMLLWVPYAHEGIRIAATSDEQFDSGIAQATVMASGTSRRLKPAAQDASMICTASLLAMSHRQREVGAGMAEAFRVPVAIVPEVGACGELAGDCGLSLGCFQRGDGSYHLHADGNVVRFSLDGAALTALAPAFVIHGGEGRTAWVYVNDRLLEPTARDEAGRLIFQLRDPVAETTVVEVLLESR